MSHKNVVGTLTPSHSFLHAFCVKPEVKFDGQFADEEVVLVLRAHPITQLPWIFNSVIFLILLLVTNWASGAIVDLSGAQFFIFNIIGFSFIASYVWFNFLSWFFNVGIVTDRRIIDIDFHLITYKEVTATRIESVEDVTAKTGGYIASLFDYGNIFVQTAGKEANIEFLKIPRPNRAAEIINSLNK